ncbi:radial spoke head protein 3 homolog isoform X1 [Tribolium castaneum]|uniref:radial spoke head protein 3 homolog isoform X1 n=1 Tax=Tribolium castaneum TaxID=7070 RepID=UPI00077D9F26|nr:PREDICTED: radial spoke head protein 3 homolog isoform X1 [Tribolium castaneum]|eukprot:XP_015836070.1 PREDICTED: radial spoke head protein 3 homolog isoform X1 [Tribolium castaneum]
MTDLAMPPVVSISSDEVDDDVAFKVLNQDNLPITIIGEAILKPFGRENQKQKPNGIVYPTRRIDTNLEENKQKTFTRSNGHINTTQDKNNYNLKKNFSNSHGNLTSATKIKPQEQVDTKFTKTLDAKLRKLQKESKSKNDNGRKPFVTTVKKGQFLEPPPEIATLIGIKVEEPKQKEIKKLYAYASEPRVLNRTPAKNVHKAKCEAAAKAAACVVAGVAGIQTDLDVNSNVNKRALDVPLPYSNLMFDRRICRGSNFAPTLSGHMPKWNPNFAYARLLSQDQGDGESAAARAAEARRRALARRKAKNQQVRAAQLRLGSPPPVPGRKHEPVQTELYLEEIFNNPPTSDICTQTELFLERPLSPYYVPAKVGIDAETQIYPGDLFDFDMEVQPILEVLVGKTVEQALIEVLEEEELAALREQQRKFLEVRSAETAEAQRLEERERRLAKEKDRRIAEFEDGYRLQKEMEERIAASVLMQGYISDLLPSVLEGLENEGFLMDSIKQDIDESFMPWLMKEVTHELKDIVSSRDVLTDIVREILENRAEIYKALNQTPRSPPSEEEEGPTQEDIVLADHLKLQEEISKKIAEEQ